MARLSLSVYRIHPKIIKLTNLCKHLAQKVAETPKNIIQNYIFGMPRETWKSKHFEENLQRGLEQASLTYGDTEKLNVLQGILMIPSQ